MIFRHDKYCTCARYDTRRQAIRAYEFLKKRGVPVLPMSWDDSPVLMFSPQKYKHTKLIEKTGANFYAFKYYPKRAVRDVRF